MQSERRLSRMVLRSFLLLASLSALVGQAEAGAWARGEGESFLALSYGVVPGEDAIGGTGSIYFERGLPWRLTAGGKLNQQTVGPHDLEFFLRRNVNPPESSLQIALEIGISYWLDGRLDELWREFTGDALDDPLPEDPTDFHDEIVITPGFEGILNRDLRFGQRIVVDEDADPDDPIMIETGRPTLALHLGRGFGSPFSVQGRPLPGGWWDMRLGVDLPMDDDEELLAEIDATLGLSLSDQTFLTFEVWHDFTAQDAFTSVVPGLGLRLGDRYALTLRYVRDLNGFPDSVEIGSWIEF
jgi:hypothetical protein